ncbi:MAG: hypothetical protein MK130_05780, partial [Puniceicoccaceae bacterium]|nr:hypothetical protein [Puniceicoccaceae bacterium]
TWKCWKPKIYRYVYRIQTIKIYVSGWIGQHISVRIQSPSQPNRIRGDVPNPRRASQLAS